MVVNIQDQYMFGDDLMVAPVLKYQQRYRTVYFPLALVLLNGEIFGTIRKFTMVGL